MSERDRGMALAMLAEAFSVRDLTPAKIKIYEQALQKVPARCLEPMVQKAITSRQFFPRVAELLDDAEAVRVELLKALTFEKCAVNEHCSDQGWTLDSDRQATRCRCWNEFQAQRQLLEVGDKPLAISAPTEPEN